MLTPSWSLHYRGGNAESGGVFELNALAGATLDHSSPVPLYHQGGPASGRGDRGRPPAGGSTLESESDLAGRLGISCPTMRAAIKQLDRKSTRLNSSHANISYAVFCLKKKNNT